MSGETTTHPTPAPIMAPPPNWADLPTDVLRCVADRLHHKPTSYLAARAVCKAWHSAMPPVSPFLIVADADPLAAASSRPFRLMALPTGSKCVGANHSWVAIAYRKHGCFYRNRKPVYRFSRNRRARTEERRYYYRNFQGEQILMDRTEVPEWQDPGGRKSFMALVNPVVERVIELPEHDKLEPWTVNKVVFAPNPRTDDYTMVVSVGWRCLAYISTRDDGAWSFGEIPEGAQYGSVIVADMVYSESGGGDDDSVYCLARSGDVYVLRVPRGRPKKPVIEPLVPELAGSHFNPASVFQAPHYTLCTMLTSAKYLAFCDGHLHQVWRNTIATPFDRRLPGGGFLPVRKDEVFVFRYDPSCRPCWRLVGDLGGLAVFVGPANSAVSVRAEGVRGLKGDCVYWVGEPGNRNS